MSENKVPPVKNPKKTREERLAEQLRANLRRRKTAVRKASISDSPKKDASQP
jgi:hypothetical protein